MAKQTGKPTNATHSSATCLVCGKHLLSAQSFVRGIGPTCLPHVVAQLPTGTNVATMPLTPLQAAIAAAKVATTPKQGNGVPVTANGTPYVTVAAVHRYIVAQSAAGATTCKVSHLVKAFGGDKALLAPLSPLWAPTYFAGNRYLHPVCLTSAGLVMLTRQAAGLPYIAPGLALWAAKPPKAPKAPATPPVNPPPAA